ncbi:MAG: hypothetical protein AB1486_21960 [Planctomycetota bacterium]
MSLRVLALLLCFGLGFTIYQRGWPFAIRGFTSERSSTASPALTKGLPDTFSVAPQGYTLVECWASW